MRAAAALMILLLGTPPAMAVPPPARTLTLENGLRVEVNPDPATPFADVWLTYRAGAKDDPIGRAGLAHLVEHLMFQGTRHLRPGEVHRLFMAAGAVAVEGRTLADETTYSVRLPAGALELAFWVFSSQMGFFLDQPDPAGALERERKVVLEELAGYLDDLDSGLRGLLAARLLYGAGHPYARLLGGNPTELARVTPADVRAFFIRHYRPDNAALHVRGPFTHAQVQALARQYFAPLPRRAPPPELAAPLVPAGVRRTTIEAPVALPEVLMLWSTPAGRDFQPLALVLDSWMIRRFRQVIQAFHESQALGGQLRVRITPADARTPQRAGEMVEEAISTLARQPLAPADLASARSMMERMAVAQRSVGEPPASPLTAKLVQALAQSLSEQPRVVITTVPNAAAPRAGRSPQVIPLVDPERPLPAVPDPPVTPDAPFRQRVPETSTPAGTRLIRDLAPLPSGLVLRHVTSSFRDDMTLDLLVRTPDGRWTPSEQATARVLVQLLEQRLRKVISSEMDVFAEPLQLAGALGLRLFGSRKHLRAVLPRFASVVTTPSADQGALETATRAAARELKRQLENPKTAPWSLLDACARGQALESAPQLKALEDVRLEDVVALQWQLFRPGNAALIATTDLPPEQLRREIVRAFSRWPVVSGPAAPARPAVAPLASRRVLIDRPDSARASVLMSFPFPHGLGTDQPAATVAAEALAGGLDSRLGRLRSRSGWLYAFGHAVVSDSEASLLLIQAEVSPGRASDLIAAVEREARDLAARALPEEELRALRSGRARAWTTNLSWTWGARDLAGEAWRIDLPLDAIVQQPKRLSAVSPAAVRAAARTYLDPARSQVIVAAPRSQAPLSGPVEHYSWSSERGVWR